MKKSTLFLASLALALPAMAQDNTASTVINTNYWYQLESCATSAPRLGAVVGLTTDDNKSLAINNSTPTVGVLWAQTKVTDTESADYPYQLFRFAEDPANPGQYALICKGNEEGCIDPTPTVTNGNAARWQFTATITYGFIPMADKEVKTTANGQQAIILTSTQQVAENPTRHMNFAAAGQQFSINSNTLENDWNSNYIALVPVTTVDGSPMPLNPALVAARKASVEAYFNASYTGAEYLGYFLDTLDECTTEEELDETYADLVNTAMFYAQSDMESGFVWKNNRTGKYATWDSEGLNFGTDEEPALSYVNLDEELTLNAYWQAEMTDDGNTAIAADKRTFRLRNVASGKYFGVINAWPGTSPAADRDEAALISLVAGTTGFEFIITNSESDKAYINASSNVNDPKLTIYSVDNDGGNFWTAAALPTFDKETQPMEVTFLGESTLTEWGSEEFTSIEGIQVKVPVGAKPSGMGTIRAFVYDDNYQPVEIYKADVAAALEGVTPAEGNIKVISWDEEFNQVITTVAADVYSIVLNPARTEAGEYNVEITPASFLLDTDDETLYSPETRNYAAISVDETFTIDVTPAAGDIEELTVITLNSWEGMAPNYGAATDANITLVCEQTTLLDIDKEKIAEYDSFDFDDASKPYYTIPVAEATKSGEYVLTIPEGFFENDRMAANELTTVTWTLKVDESGIATITDVKVTTYDLQGRKTTRTTGIRIAGGKVVL